MLTEANTGNARGWRAALTLVATAVLLAASTARAQDATPRQWDRETAQSLVAYIERVGSHGLDPADYAPVDLERAIASGDAARLSARRRKALPTWRVIWPSAASSPHKGGAIISRPTRPIRKEWRD